MSLLVWGTNKNDDIYHTVSDGEKVEWKKINGSAKCISVGIDGTVWCVNKSDEIYRYKGGNDWERIEGSAKQISVNNANQVWCVNSKDEIYSYKEGRGWKRIDGSAKQISVGANEIVWCCNKDNDIYRREGEDGKWQKIDGKLKWVSVGHKGDDSVYGCNGSNEIYKYLGNNKWQKLPGSAKQISSLRDNIIFCVNGKGEIYASKNDGEKWTRIEGELQNVSINSIMIKVWGTNKNDEIYTAETDGTGADWTKINGSAKCISIGTDGEVWCVNKSDEIYRHKGGNDWERIDGSAKQISVNNKNQIWCVNSKDEIYRYKGNNKWQRIDGSAKQISVGGGFSKEIVWCCNKDNDIYRREGENGKWQKIDGKLKWVSVGHSGDDSVYGCNGSNEIYKYLGDNKWKKLPGKAKQISSLRDNIIVCVNGKGEIYASRNDGEKWNRIPGELQNVSINVIGGGSSSSSGGGHKVVRNGQGAFDKPYIFKVSGKTIVIKHKHGKFVRVKPGNLEQVNENGGVGEFAQWEIEVEEAKENQEAIIKLKSKKSGKYLRIYDNGNKFDVGGGGGKWTRFRVKVQRDKGLNVAKLESVELSGKYPAIQPGGPAVGGGGQWTEFEFYRKD